MAKLENIKTSWDLTPILTGDKDPKISEYRKVTQDLADKFVAKWRNRTDYMEKPEVLLEAMDEMEALERTNGVGNEAYYFHMRTSIDSNSSELKAREDQSRDFLVGIINNLRFFWLNVQKIDPKSQSEFLEFEGLQPYRHNLETAFARAKYSLSEAEEKILTLKSDPSYNDWVRMTTNFLYKEEREIKGEDGKVKKVNLTQLLTLSSSTNKAVRKNAAAAIEELLAKNVDVAEAELNAVLKNKKIDDELRGYTRADASRHMSDDIEPEVVDALLDAVEGRYDIAHRYYALKAKLLDLPKITYFERNVPYASSEKTYKFDEACDLVCDVFDKLDPDFSEIFKSYLQSGQIDAFPAKGKRGGAFCTAEGVQHPVYVMLNHTDKLNDVTTIAHEMGHAINDEYIKRHQNSLNFSVSMATAEVASNFMEDFVLDRLLADAGDELELGLRINKLDDAMGSIFRQTSLYRFEQKLHESFRKQGYLSKEEIGKIFRDASSAMAGPSVEYGEGSKYGWMYIPHIRYFFYVYSYVSGLLIAQALQAKVREDHEFISNIKTFFSTGVSKSPRQIFAEMDIDITDKAFWNQGLDEIETLLNETEILAKKLGKI